MRKKLLASLIIMVLAIGCMAPAMVSADTYVRSGFACKKGSNVYFAFTSTKKSTPIYKFNTKTGKTVKVAIKRVKLKEFKHLSTNGKYLFCAARPARSLSCTYIYRINLKTGSTKKLAKGTKPTLVGDKIVFEGIKAQKVNDNLSYTYVPSGKDYMIPQEGGRKQPVSHVELSAETSCRGTKIASGKYKYYISKDGKKIYRKNGKNKKLVCKAKKITGFRVLGGYLVVKTTKKGRNYAYCVKSNGSKSTKMLRW